MPTIPASSADLTPEWLTEVLRDNGVLSGEHQVVTATPVEFAEGVGFLSHLHRLALESDGPAPASVIVKLPTTTEYRQLADGADCYRRETAFYANVAGAAPLRAPHAYLAAQATDSTDFVLVLEDLGGLEGCDQLVGISAPRLDRVVDELAGLHAWSIAEGARVASDPAFPTIAQQTPLYLGSFPTGWDTYRANARVPVPPGIEAFATRFPDLLPAMLQELSGSELVLGDFRVDNMFFGPDDELTVVDFQFAMRACGIYDVAYVASQGVTTDVRAGRDGELVTRYLDAIGKSDTFEQAFEQYRVSAAVQLAFPLGAMLWWDALPARARELCLTLVERCIATLEETDALGLVMP